MGKAVVPGPAAGIATGRLRGGAGSPASTLASASNEAGRSPSVTRQAPAPPRWAVS